MNINLLPADSYIVVNKTIINEFDKKLITTLYQPIIGHEAVSLYLTLLNEINDDTMSIEYNHHHLMTLLQISLENLQKTKEKLEGIGLLKSFIKQDNINHYVYEIYSPICANEFFNHPILNIVLYNNVGKKEYNRLVNMYKVVKVNLKDYDEVTKSFKQVYKSTPGSITFTEEIQSKSSNDIEVLDLIDFSLLEASIPKGILNKRAFSKENKAIINNIAYVYNLDDLKMQSLIRNVINEKGMIDKIELRKQARNMYQFNNAGKLPTLIYKTQPEYLKTPTGDSSKWAKMVYTFENTTPYDYLKSKQKGAEPTARDLKIIESLLIDMKLNPGVVNVLIAYVLKINDQKLNKNYIDTIAAQWKRVGIETVEEAMRYSEKQHQQMKKNIANKKTNPKAIKEDDSKLPDWFNKELSTTQMSDEEEKELKDMLSNF